MNLANKITLFRVFLIPIFLYFLLSKNLEYYFSSYVSLSIFLLASASDFLDGYIARSQKMITDFGKFVDPLADKLLVSSALIAFIELDRLDALVVILIISREFIVTGFRLIAVSKNVVIAATTIAKVKTILQFALIIWLLMPNYYNTYKNFTNFLVICTIFLTIYSCIEYIYTNRKLLK